MSTDGEEKRGLSRREFLQAVGGAAALSAVAGGWPAEGATAGMRYRRLGRTELMVSELGIGCSPAGQRQDRDTYLRNIGDVMRLGLDRGINIYDSAPSYSGSEDAIGKAFSGIRRDSYILCTKAEQTRKAGIIKGLEESLKRLRTDYVDLFHEHGHYHRPEGAYGPLEFVEACQELKKQGKIRFFGCSGHNPAVLAEYIRTGHFDTVMVPYNHLTRDAERVLFAVAQQMDVGAIAIKPLTGNFKPWDRKPGQDARLDRLMKEYNAQDYVSAALRFVLHHPVVASAMTGMERIQDVEANVATVRTRLQKADRSSLDTYAGLFGGVYCRMCETCQPCPNGVATADIQRYYMYYAGYGHRERARDLYAAVPALARADRCAGCGDCEQRCPHGLPVREKLKRAHEVLA